MLLQLDRYASPVGEILVVFDEAGRLRALDFHDFEPRLMRLLKRHYGAVELAAAPAPAAIVAALDAYFAGDHTALDALETATGGTAFQREVWAELRRIPAGQAISYGELARRLGRPGSSRAVGAANGANPIALVAPCHRVVGANGKLTGYAGGLARKEWLLAHEGRGGAQAMGRTSLDLPPGRQ